MIVLQNLSRNLENFYYFLNKITALAPDSICEAKERSWDAACSCMQRCISESASAIAMDAIHAFHEFTASRSRDGRDATKEVSTWRLVQTRYRLVRQEAQGSSILIILFE